jgi:hypothetical protein
MGRDAFIYMKEVIHPHLPVGVPCYDFIMIKNPTLGGVALKGSTTEFE